jgi:hypothetical protein
MLSRSQFTVDLWFIFGSFCYGAEARILACRQESLLLQLAPATQAAVQELAVFFDSINEKAKSLIRSEVRIFVNSSQEESSDDWGDELIVTLMSELKPRHTLCSTSEGGTPNLQVEILDVRGLTPNDQIAWSNLVADIWPQLPA